MEACDPGPLKKASLTGNSQCDPPMCSCILLGAEGGSSNSMSNLSFFRQLRNTSRDLAMAGENDILDDYSKFTFITINVKH